MSLEASVGHRVAEIIVQHMCARMVYPIDLRQKEYLDLRQEAHALPYNGFTCNLPNSETEIYDTTMSMLNGCPL